MPTKTKKQLTCRTAFSVYEKLYKDMTGQEYVVSTFIGREMSMLKNAIDKHDYYGVLCALLASLKKNGKTATIPYTLGGLSYYLPDCKRPDLYWLVLTRPSDSCKIIWRRLMRLETKWFPAASDKKTYSNLVLQLEQKYGLQGTQAELTPTT